MNYFWGAPKYCGPHGCGPVSTAPPPPTTTTLFNPPLILYHLSFTCSSMSFAFLSDKQDDSQSKSNTKLYFWQAVLMWLFIERG